MKKLIGKIWGNAKMKRCTMCEKKLDTVDLHGDFSFYHRVGYGSKHDGDIVYLKLCRDCFDKVVDILSMMSKEKIVFSPEELSESGGYYMGDKKADLSLILPGRIRCRIKE